MSFKVPVAIIAFRRPDLTRLLLDKIGTVKPKSLFIILDAARANNPQEKELVQQTRKQFEQLNWKPELIFNAAESNMGCRKRLSSGLSWVFEQVPEAIILEDDCLPHPSFFPFCEELLERYRNDDRVSMVCGSNHTFGRSDSIPQSYYFSRYGHIWGWATWKRVWKDYDVTMKTWPAQKSSGLLRNVFGSNAKAIKSWERSFDCTHQERIDTWDHQLTYLNWMKNRVSIIPKQNLVSNMGFRQDGTHTNRISRYGDMPTHEMHFPLVHPQNVSANIVFDEFVESDQYSPKFSYRVFRKLNEMWKS